MSDEIVLDGVIKADTTNWKSNEIKITFSSTIADAEYEREHLGNLASSDMLCTVRIHEKNADINTALDLACKVTSVRTNHKTGEVTTAISVHVTEENISKVRSLGVLAARERPVTARFEPRQMELAVDGQLREVEEDPDDEEKTDHTDV